MTIYWLLDSAPPNLVREVLPLLGETERRRCAGLKSPKRRRDWLLGRWAAKTLLRQVLGELPSVLNDKDGVPYVVGYPDLHISISHSGDFALCALTVDGAVGADLEQIAPRSAAFVADYFTPPEIAFMAQAPDTLPTLLWSAKEAALKALHVGLSVDTRAVEIQAAQPALKLSCAYGMAQQTPVTARDFTAACGGRGQLAGWWQIIDDYALTLALKTTTNTKREN